MEMNLKQLSTQKTDATTGSVKMRLSENATSMVFQLFTKNIYSNPKGTVVREITSNCFDSHVEAKVNAPVRIRKWFNGQDNSHYISFIDYGMGMSPDRVNNIYGVYFESTKRTTNEQIGGFGIGGKTPLAYKRKTGHGEGEYDNQFYVVTVFDGVKYFYCITEGEECPEITLLHSEPTTEHNGTEVRVPILERDIQDFEKEMIRQLYYFENIIFEGFDEKSNVTNDYKIIQGKTFLFRGDDYEGEMHVCLGRVAYPINYNVLNLNYNDYRIPIAIKLEVGEINVIASREQLDYNETTIKVLKRKMEEAKAEIKAMLAKQYENIITLEQYFQAKNNFGTLYFSNGMSINTGKMIVFKDLDLSNFKYSFLKMPNDKQLFKFFFNVRTLGKKTRSRRNRYNSDTTFEGGYDEVQGRNDLFYYEGEEFNRKIVKQAYLKSEYGTYYMINKRNIHLRSDIADLFNVHLDSTIDKNGKPVKFVKGLLAMQEEYFEIVCKFIKNYDKVEVPADYLAERKNRQVISKEMRAIKISLKFGGRNRYDGISLGMLFDYDMPIFYGTQEDEYKLCSAERMYDVLFDNKAAVSSYSDYYHKFSNGYDDNSKNKKSIMFIALAKNNIKYMQYCKKAKHVDEFFTGMLKRREDKVKNYFHTYDIVKEWENVGTMFRSKSFSELNAVWGSKIENVRTFIKAVKGDDNLGNMKSELSRYFDLSKQKETAAQKIIRLQIDEIRKLEEQNTDILRYISLPYDWDSNASKHPVLIDILQKVMVF
ncbi:MAG: hypothetical protein WC333_02165 [Dehalococcoidia bacterium]|jgi:hypothetical protein